MCCHPMSGALWVCWCADVLSDADVNYILDRRWHWCCDSTAWWTNSTLITQLWSVFLEFMQYYYQWMTTTIPNRRVTPLGLRSTVVAFSIFLQHCNPLPPVFSVYYNSKTPSMISISGQNIWDCIVTHARHRYRLIFCTPLVIFNLCMHIYIYA